MKCIIYASLSDTKEKLVAWDHNSDNEYWMFMTFIQRVRCIHSEFEEKCGGDKINFTVDFRKECCMELGYQIEKKINSKCSRVNIDLFRGIDNIFQLAFRTREIWELINEILACGITLALKTRRPKGLNH